MLALSYSALGVFLLHLYGTRVCPFIESLSGVRLLGQLALTFAIGAAARAALTPLLVEAAPPPRRAFRVMALELALHVAMGLGLGLYSTAVLEFPTPSGVKIVLGFFTLGLFASFDVALARQRAEFRVWDACSLELGHTVSVTRLLMLGFAVSLLLSGVVIVLAVKKDVDYLLVARATSAARHVMVDVLFTVGVIGALGLRVLYAFARNMRMLFDAQLTTLAAVERGQLDRYVPVMTGDEFGVIAAQTNRMIDGLREKERVKQVLGKVVSPEIAKRLMAGAEHSQRVELAILFCDLRDFTSLSERTPPEELVALLNTYFTRMVACIEAERGVVDKFIGDAVLATFGLAGDAQPGAQAVRAAFAMVAAADEMGGLVNGVGVHFGPVVAGTIGSPDRFEYTVIGDAVNAASRLESLCKPLNRRVLVSREAHAHLPPELSARLRADGEHTVKGRARALEVFGFPG